MDRRTIRELQLCRWGRLTKITCIARLYHRADYQITIGCNDERFGPTVKRLRELVPDASLTDCKAAASEYRGGKREAQSSPLGDPCR
jgi:hypothetical protein